MTSKLTPPTTFITDPNTGAVAAVEKNNALAVNIQDQHSTIVDWYFLQQLNSTTLSVAASAGDTTITLTSTTGYVDGVRVGIFNVVSGRAYFGQQIGAPAGNVITLDTPLDIDFLINSPSLAATIDMDVNGSITTEVFQIGPVGPGATIEIDITRIMGYIQDGTAMDDSKFGGISALTYGVALRINNTDMINIWNSKTNGDFGLLCYDTEYSDKAPAGSYGFRFRNTFAGQNKHGVTIRLEPGDTLEILIQDDLTDLESFRMMAQGHYVTD